MEKYIKKRENIVEIESKKNYFVCTYNDKLIEMFQNEPDNHFDGKLVIEEERLTKISFFHLLNHIYNERKDKYLYYYLLNEFSKDLYKIYTIQNPEIEIIKPVEYDLDIVRPIASEPSLLIEIREKIDKGTKNNDYSHLRSYKTILGSDFVSRFPISKAILQNKNQVMKAKKIKKIIDTLITFSKDKNKVVLIHARKCKIGLGADYYREALQCKMLLTIYRFYQISPTTLINE